ncbi:hypothetical protein ABTX83_15915 [Streptomyces werraensis]
MSRVARKDPAEQRPEPLTPDEEAVVRPLRRVIAIVPAPEAT